MCYRTLLLLQMRVFSVFELHQHFLRVTVPSSLLPLQPCLLMIPRHPLILFPVLADSTISWWELVQQLYYQPFSSLLVLEQGQLPLLMRILRQIMVVLLASVSKQAWCETSKEIHFPRLKYPHTDNTTQINLLSFEFFFVEVIRNIMYKQCFLSQ